MKSTLKKFTQNKAFIYTTYIFLSCIFTSALNILHTQFILGDAITFASFIIPNAAGTIFGYLLATNRLLSDQLTGLAYTDSLTNIYNRLHFGHFLEAEIDKIKRYGGTFAIIFLDIDHFKKVNDTHGHLVGDEILKELAKIITKNDRGADIFARFGGEEFIIMASSTDITGACEHAERLRRTIEQHQFKTGQITCSFGVTEFDPVKDNSTSLLERADAALYEAKAKGRNCVTRL